VVGGEHGAGGRVVEDLLNHQRVDVDEGGFEEVEIENGEFLVFGRLVVISRPLPKQMKPLTPFQRSITRWGTGSNGAEIVVRAGQRVCRSALRTVNPGAPDQR
jgi:hypothetical protein